MGRSRKRGRSRVGTEENWIGDEKGGGCRMDIEWEEEIQEKRIRNKKEGGEACENEKGNRVKG